jgi:acyl-CoA synthetase (AMP-forming)/AMP-acid ligase II
MIPGGGGSFYASLGGTGTAGAGGTGVDQIHQTTIVDVLDQHRSSSGRPACVCGPDRYSYAELDERTDRLAAVFRSLGVGDGDRVLWMAQNCHRLLEALLASAKVGAILCIVNWRQSADELEFVLTDFDPAIVFWQEAEIGEISRKARQQAESARARPATWIQHDGSGSDGYEAIIAPFGDGGAVGGGSALGGAVGGSGAGALGSEIKLVSEADPVLMLYTAAFGGRPAGALLSHRALVTQGTLIGPIQGIGSDYVYLNCGPLFHVATLMTTLATFVYGGTNVFTPRVDAEELCRLIDAEGCTGAFIMPPTMSQIVELNADGRYDLHTLRTFPGKPEWTAMITTDDSPWGRRPAGYGQTEVMGLVSFNAFGPSIGSHGRIAPFLRVAILDPAGREVAQGETGEICVRGPTVMNGYYNRPELNTERRAAAWHHTNDLGRIESDGSLTFIAPRSRLIKSAAENIYPTEVEACIRTHPRVADVGVIGVPDRQWGQNVVAVVVLESDGASDAGDNGATGSEVAGEVTADEIIEHCRARIASYKKPKSVEFVDSLPRQGFSVDYEALDERFGGGGYPGAGG